MERFKTNLFNKLLIILVLLFILILFLFIASWVGLFSFISLLIKAILPLLTGVFISFLLEPIIEYFDNNVRNRTMVVTIVYLLFMIILFLLGKMLLPSIISQILDFIKQLPSFIDDITSGLPDSIMYVLDMFKVEQQLSLLFEHMISSSWSSLSGFFDAFTSLSIGVGSAYFISLDFKGLKRMFYRIPPKKYRRDFRELSQKFGNVTFYFLSGMLLDSVIMFIMTAVALYCINFEYPLVFALIMALTNLIPYIGPYLGQIPIIVAGFTMSHTIGIQSTVIAFVAQYIESTYVQPIILRNVIDLHPVTGIIAVSVFGAMFGIPGMVLSPILATYIRIVYLHFNPEKVKQISSK